jgi:hypothetical protein
MKTISTSPPNSLILVMDFASGIIPEAMGNGLVSATESCVAVGCRSEHDGPTEIHLGQAQEAMPAEALVFDGDISTPNKKLSICSVMNEELLSTEVLGEITHVTILADDPMEPNRVFVLFDR